MKMDNYLEKIENISRLLQERTAVFPVRDSSFYKLDLSLQNFAESLIADIELDNYQYDPNLVRSAMSLSDSPLFICGSMKSGTTLLIHLLDSHPKLLVMPGDSWFFNELNKWNRLEFKDIAFYWIHRIVNPTGQEPFWFFGKEEETFKVFLFYLKYFLQNSDKHVFVCVVMSFYAVYLFLSNPPSKKYWVEKTPQNELNAQKLSRMFPKAKFIHVLRDPLNNIASLRKLDTYRRWKGSTLSHARVIKRLFRSAQKNLEKIGNENYLIIKYEELTKNPSLVMNRICAFLDIEYDQTLLTPTENGKLAISNSMFQNDRVMGEILNREQNLLYQKEFTRAELENIVTTLYSTVSEAGYNWNLEEIAQYKKEGVFFIQHLIVEYLENMLLELKTLSKKWLTF